MSLRIRWHDVTPFDKESLKKLQVGFSRQEYSERKPRGYSHLRSEGTCLRGHYVERFDFVSTVEDPFGRVLQIPRVEFEKVIFAFSLNAPVLELQDPPRSLGTFLNSVAQTLDFKVAIQTLEVDLTKWLKALVPQTDSLTVSGALATNVTLTNSVTARVAVAGTSDVRASLRRFLGRSTCAITRLQLSGVLRSLPFKCELFSDAKVTISSGVEEELTSVLRIALGVALGKT